MKDTGSLEFVGNDMVVPASVSYGGERWLMDYVVLAGGDGVVVYPIPMRRGDDCKAPTDDATAKKVMEAAGFIHVPVRSTGGEYDGVWEKM